MRLWSLHPKYLDRQGLLAIWREGLLAQKVLRGETRGYRHHPQLERFRTQPDPLAAIGAYLTAIAHEAEKRGYSFDHTKITCRRVADKLPVTRGQMLFEWQHLEGKLHRRDPQRAKGMANVGMPDPHPLFEIINGEIEAWEKGKSA
jgi:hypothetical protein